jgi:hypothetical protein
MIARAVPLDFLTIMLNRKNVKVALQVNIKMKQKDQNAMVRKKDF